MKNIFLVYIFNVSEQNSKDLVVRFTPKIHQAIIKLMADKKWKQIDLANHLGVHSSVVRKWLKDEVKTISDPNWEKLNPLLDPYISSEDMKPVERARKSFHIGCLRLIQHYKKENKLDYEKLAKEADMKVWEIARILEEWSDKQEETYFVDGDLVEKFSAFIVKASNYFTDQLNAKDKYAPTPLPNLINNTDGAHPDHPYYKNLAGGHGGYLEKDHAHKGYIEGFGGKENVTIFQIIGDSMLPTVADKEEVAVRDILGGIHLGPEGNTPLDIIRAEIPDNSLAVISINDEPVTVKRIKYSTSKDRWGLYIHADNKEWGEENGFPRNGRLLYRHEDLRIFGRVLGKVSNEKAKVRA